MCAKSLKQLYQDTRDMLRETGAEQPEALARDLIKRSIDINDMDIILGSEQPVFEAKVQEINDCLRRHISGEPVSRIFGEREFYGLTFKITPDVLDPRQDTETIIAVAVKRFFGDPPETILDLGTGSGCIVISLLTEWPLAQAVAVDISKPALAVARQNAERHEVLPRLKLVHSDWGAAVKGRFDVIVSNPPYISNRELANLPPEVKNFDPILALDGGADGLDCYRIIFTEIKKRLKPGGVAFVEIGHTQAADISRLVEDSGLSVITVHPDSAGILRVVEISSGEK